MEKRPEDEPEVEADEPSEEDLKDLEEPEEDDVKTVPHRPNGGDNELWFMDYPVD